MKKNIIPLLLAFATLAPAIGASNIKEVNAGEESVTLNFSNFKQAKMRAREVEMGDEKGAYETAVNAWVNSETYDSGIAFFNQYSDSNPEENAENLRKIKDSYYVFSEIQDYVMSGTKVQSSDQIDLYRNYLDHAMPMKENLLDIFTDLSESRGFLEFFADMRGLYESFSNTVEDMTDNFSAESKTEVYRAIRNGIVENSKNANGKKIDEKTYYVNMLKSINDLENTDAIVTNFLNNKRNATKAEDLFTFDTNTLNQLEQIEDDNERNAAYKPHVESAMNIFLYVAKSYNEFEQYLAVIPGPFSCIMCNMGPLSYKLLELIEATFYEDNPNILILAYDMLEDINNLISLAATEDITKNTIAEFKTSPAIFEEYLSNIDYFKDSLNYSKSVKVLDEKLEEAEYDLDVVTKYLEAFNKEDKDIDGAKAKLIDAKTQLETVKGKLLLNFILLISLFVLTGLAIFFIVFLLLRKKVFAKQKSSENE